MQSKNTNLRCPRNGQTDEPLRLHFCHIATDYLEQVIGKATKVVSASPDTGQQGSSALAHCILCLCTVGDDSVSVSKNLKLFFSYYLVAAFLRGTFPWLRVSFVRIFLLTLMRCFATVFRLRNCTLRLFHPLVASYEKPVF